MLNFSVLVSQEKSDRITYFGVKAGLNSSTFSGESTKNVDGRESDVQSKFGFYVGGFFKYKINSKYAIQPELLFANQTTRIDINRWEGVPVKAGSDIHLPYILMPVLFQYKPIRKLKLEIGPQLGYNLGKFITIKGKVELNNETFDLEERLNEIARWDFSLMAGLGYDITDSVSTKLRFAQGINSLDQRENDAFELYHQVLTLGLEYKL